MTKSCLKKNTVGLLLLIISHYCMAVVSISEVAVVDVGNNRVYLQSDSGKLISLELSTGLEYWESSQNMKPISVIDGLLIAQIKPNAIGELTLAYVNPIDGKLSSTINITLASDVKAVMNQTMNDSFQIKVDENNNLFWKYNHQKVGAHFSETNPLKSIFGKIVIDASSRNLQNVTISSIQYPKHNRITNLLSNIQGRQILSEDKNNVLVVSNDNTSKNGFYYLWKIFGVNGNKLTEFKSRQGFSPFVIKDNNLVFVQSAYSRKLSNETIENSPLKIIVYDIMSHQIIWEKAIANTNYNKQIAP